MATAVDHVPPAMFTSPAAAAQALVDRLSAVPEERIALSAAAGRITAQPVRADRPSPPSDVSAMDGYAVRLADLTRGPLAVAATVLPGRPAPFLPAGEAVRIMTGAVVPYGAEAVIRREEVRENGDQIALDDGLQVTAGQNIRRRGENIAADGTVIDRGVPIGPAAATALASFGAATVSVHRRVRLAVLVTGDELRQPGAAVADWEIRDSNGPALHAMLAGCPWIEWMGAAQVPDEFAALHATVGEHLPRCDALLLTGGVSAGTHDFVPHALRQAGCDIVFHKLPLRPGHPLLAAVGPEGQAVLGLPGNPQSVMTTMRRIGAVALRRRAGLADPLEHRPAVKLINADTRTLHLWWYRPVRLVADGEAELVESKGSGDVVAAARSEGFVELPPHATGAGPWPFYGWNLGL